MTSSGFVRSFITLLALSGAAHSAPAFADDFCMLPVCEMQSTLDEFKALREDRRYSFIEQYQQDYAINADVAASENLVEFTMKAKAILNAETPKQDSVIGIASNLLDQSNEQIATYAPIAAGKLVPSFRALQTQAPRFRVIRAWEAQIPSMTDVAALRKLRDFYSVAGEVSTAAKDEEYVIRESSLGILLVNDRIVAVSPAAPQLALPVVDMAAAVKQYQGLDIPTRFLMLKSLTTTYQGSPESKKLMSLVAFGRAVLEALKTDASSEVNQVTQATLLVSQSLEQIVRNNDVTAQEMATYYSQLVNGATRFAALSFWNEKTATMTDLAALRKLVVFFGLAKTTSISLQDDEYVSREAARLEAALNAKLVTLASASVITMPIVTDTAVATFKNMMQYERSLLITKLAADYATSTDGAALISIFKFAKAITPVLDAAGPDQASIASDNKNLIAQTVDLLTKNRSLSAADLVTYYKELPTQAQRLSVIRFWSTVVDTSTSKTELQNLYTYFGLARSYSNQVEDEAYVVREIVANQTKARTKLSTIAN